MNTAGIIGHKRQIDHLNNLIKNQNIPHTVLFTGPSGIGKKSIAQKFISTFFCKNDNSPCLSCPVCSQIKQGTFPDYIEIAPNEKGIIPIGNEEKLEPGSVRWLIGRLTKRSLFGKTGVVIDGVDRITEEGQNALLKTTEEPSLEAYFILVSSNRAKILPTILSRCSEIRFHPLTDNEIRQILKIKNLPLHDSELVTYLSGGSVETASILAEGETLDEILSVCGRISSYWKSSAIFNVDLTPLQKKIGHTKLLDIIITLFRRNLLFNIKHDDPVPPSLKEIFIDNSEFISYLIKIFLALKKSESQNINIKHALKGMIYAFNSEDTKNIPLTHYYGAQSGG